MNLFNNLFQIENIAAKQEDYPAVRPDGMVKIINVLDCRYYRIALHKFCECFFHIFPFK